jgi:cell division protein FtsW (lipid II flippase)
VAHTPILIFLAAVLAGDTRWLPGVKASLVALAALLLILAYAWLLAFLTEFRTDRVRAWLEGRLIGAAT